MNFEVLAIGSNCPTLNPLSQPDGPFSIEFAELPTRSALSEPCLDRMILFGEGSLRKAIHEFIEHYHHERNHQGLGNRLTIQEPLVADSAAAVQSRSRLGGMLNYYYRQAA